MKVWDTFGMHFTAPQGGFFDGHCHPLFAGRELAGAILHDCENTDDLQQAISVFRNSNPELSWLDLSAISPDSELANQLSRHVLDQIVSDIPLVIHTSDHHSIVVNSSALQVAGFSESAPPVEGGRFDTDSSGRPNGWIHEYVAMSLIYAYQPKPTVEADLQALIAAQEMLLGFGVTKLLDAWIDPGMPQTYFEAVSRDLLKLTVELAPRIKPESWQDDLEFAERVKTQSQALGSKKLACNTVKIFMDGVHSSNTAHLLRDSRTSSLWQFETLLEMATKADLAGFELHLHACGDAAVRTAIDAIELVLKRNPKRLRRPVIAHADEIAESDIPRLAQLGIEINTQPSWLSMEQPDWHPLRKLLDAGVKLSFGSDWPVSSPDPKVGLAVLTELGKQNPEWALTEQEALAAYSRG